MDNILLWFNVKIILVWPLNHICLSGNKAHQQRRDGLIAILFPLLGPHHQADKPNLHVQWKKIELMVFICSYGKEFFLKFTSWVLNADRKVNDDDICAEQ